MAAVGTEVEIKYSRRMTGEVECPGHLLEFSRFSEYHFEHIYVRRESWANKIFMRYLTGQWTIGYVKSSVSLIPNSSYSRAFDNLLRARLRVFTTNKIVGMYKIVEVINR